MTTYINPSTRSGGADQIVVAERAPSIEVGEAPFDDAQYVRVNGEWVPYDAPPIIPDTLAPSSPTSLSASGAIISDGSQAIYTLTWVAPTTNIDATPLTDLAYYVVRWRYVGETAWASFVANDTSALLPGLRLGVNVEWQVLARDISGNDSPWAGDTLTGETDTVGPNKPSAPTVTTRLGTITATWNGLDNVGGAPPADFHHLEFFSSATTGGPWVYFGQISGAGSSIIANVPVGETRFITTVAVDSSGNDSPRSDEVSITVQGVTGPDMEANSVTANSIVVGALQVEKFSGGSLQAGVEIIAGDVLGHHAKMTSTGFYVFAEDPVDLIPDERIRMGTDTGDLFAITGADGSMRASISSEGKGAFTGLSVDATTFDAEDKPAGGLTIYGTEFLDHLKGMARGIVAKAVRTSASATSTGAEIPVLELQYFEEPGRQYKIYWAAGVVNGTAGGREIVTLRRTIDGTTPGITSTMLRGARIHHHATTPGPTVWQFGTKISHNNGSSPLDVRLLLGLDSESGNVYIEGSAEAPLEFWVEDIGPAIPDTGIDRGEATPPVTKQTYVSTWNASNSEGYTGSGAAETSDADFKQGYSSADGDSHGVAVFAGTAVSGETGKTISTALSGATLNKVEVYLYANHWYYSSGGTALIRAYNSTTLSSATPSGTIKTVTGWPKPGGKWVDITSVSTSSIRGVTVGKAGSTNLIYYGRFNGHTQSYKPQLRLTYTR